VPAPGRPARPPTAGAPQHRAAARRPTIEMPASFECLRLPQFAYHFTHRRNNWERQVVDEPVAHQARAWTNRRTRPRRPCDGCSRSSRPSSRRPAARSRPGDAGGAPRRDRRDRPLGAARPQGQHPGGRPRRHPPLPRRGRRQLPGVPRPPRRRRRRAPDPLRAGDLDRPPGRDDHPPAGARRSRPPLPAVPRPPRARPPPRAGPGGAEIAEHDPGEARRRRAVKARRFLGLAAVAAVTLPPALR
jgi:hypothetical protein